MEMPPRSVVAGTPTGYAQVESICRWVRDTISYRREVSDQNTDALDTLNLGAGICRDYAHVGDALDPG